MILSSIFIATFETLKHLLKSYYNYDENTWQTTSLPRKVLSKIYMKDVCVNPYTALICDQTRKSVSGPPICIEYLLQGLKRHGVVNIQTIREVI